MWSGPLSVGWIAAGLGLNPVQAFVTPPLPEGLCIPRRAQLSPAAKRSRCGSDRSEKGKEEGSSRCSESYGAWDHGLSDSCERKGPAILLTPLHEILSARAGARASTHVSRAVCACGAWNPRRKCGVRRRDVAWLLRAWTSSPALLGRVQHKVGPYEVDKKSGVPSQFRPWSLHSVPRASTWHCRISARLPTRDFTTSRPHASLRV